jgi:DNA repair protein RadD
VIPILKSLQMDHVERIRQARRDGARIIVVQGATGYGKNTVAAYLARCAVQKNIYTLMMVHRRKLVDQISERLLQFETQHGIIMRGEKPDPKYLVQVASRDTLMSRCVNNNWLGMPPAGLVIVDEAHHAWDPSSDYRRILMNYPEATILLVTATPACPDGSGLGPWAQAIVCAAPTSQLIREGYLVGLKCFAPERRQKGSRILRGVAGDLVGSWRDYGEERQSVTFFSRVQHSLKGVENFRAAGIMAEHMDADTTDDDRERIFDNIASGKTKVLCNVGIIGEGVDMPDLGCCQLFCDINSRIGLLQRAGRIMRISEGKEYGILIDHAGAVFHHGFPDEDTDWTLTGNQDEAFAKKHDAGETAKAFYCKKCALVYKGQPNCPQCGRAPSKPPKSIFAPPPMRPRNELLTEADRDGETGVWSREEKIRTWFACLSLAKKKNSTFKMASAVYKQKYDEWPSDDFPLMPPWSQRGEKVADVYPEFGRKKAEA